MLLGMAGLPLQNPSGADEARTSIENKFLVPYLQNPHFTGRQAFLETLKENLFAHVPKQFNHRVALYGMGGVGKTQTALAYVYANKHIYSRIYWITAIDQAAMLSGYQKIARAAGIQIHKEATPTVIVEAVFTWLRQEQNWLLVIDNLDDIKVADRLLPENEPDKHTLL